MASHLVTRDRQFQDSEPTTEYRLCLFAGATPPRVIAKCSSARRAICVIWRHIWGDALKDSRKRTGRGQAVRVEDVAREAGVSPITVSRALSRPEKVRPETRERVAQAVLKTGYVVNSFASTLRSGHSPVIAVFASNLRNHVFADVMQGCTDALEGSGYQLLTARAGESEPEQRRVIESIIPFRPAAMLFTDLVRGDDIRSIIAAQKVPVVEMWDQRQDPVDKLITISEYDNGRLMGEHFARQGFSRIAYAGPLYDRGKRRIEGFREALQEHGLGCEVAVHMERGWSAEAGATLLGKVLAQMPDCDAVFFGSDMLAAGGLAEARSRGMRVPDDIAIAGFGDVDLARYFEPPLTSLFIAGYDMGRKAGELLRSGIRNERQAENIITFPLRLEARRSTSRTG